MTEKALVTRPAVTLLTDFGYQDTFVGQMKGVILTYCQDVSLIDLTHSIPPQSVLTGAVHLGAAWHWFPKGTIHIAVVDPGVGGARRPIALKYGGHFFIGPDNGVFDGVLGSDEPDSVVELSIQDVPVSRTFHGRDVFARAAGTLLNAGTLAALGERVDPGFLVRNPLPEPVTHADMIEGEILIIDHYGNAISNIGAELLGDAPESWAVRCGQFVVPVVSRTYSDVEPGSKIALISSMGTVELAVRDASAAARYDLASGMRLKLNKQFE